MAEAARMMADLGSKYREIISAPLEGRTNARTAELQETAIRDEDDARRGRILGGGDKNDPQHKALTGWNTIENFGGDSVAEDLQNRYNGQGHRKQLQQTVGRGYDQDREMQENRHGEERRMYMQDRGGMPPRAPPPRAPRPALTSTTANRQRPPSPRSQGTVRFLSGIRQAAPGAIPTISPQLATNVTPLVTSPTSAFATPAASSTPASSSMPAVSPALAAATTARPSSPAMSVASSTSGTALHNAQARLRAHVLARQQALATPAQSTTTAAPSRMTEAPSRPPVSNAAPPSSTPATTATAPPTTTEAPSRETVSSTAPHSSTPAAALISTRFSSAGPAPAPTATSRAPHNARPTTNGISAQGAATPEPAVRNSEARISAARVRITEVAAQAPVKISVPRLRMTGPTTNGSVSNDTASQVAPARTRATNEVASPASTTASVSSSGAVPAPAPTPRAPAVQNVNARAQATSLRQTPNESATVKAKIHALARTREELAGVEEYYKQYPEGLSVLSLASKQLVEEVVNLAASGDAQAAEQYVQGRHPCRRWVMDAAIAARAGRAPENEGHPLIQKVIKATKAEKSTTGSKESVVAPSVTRPAIGNGAAPTSDSPDSATTAESNSTAVSTPTPPRTAHGILAAAYYSLAGSFLGNREYKLSVPVKAHINITTQNGEFDPLQLADAMEAFAKQISNLKSSA